jgi:hypothetical protein
VDAWEAQLEPSYVAAAHRLWRDIEIGAGQRAARYERCDGGSADYHTAQRAQAAARGRVEAALLFVERHTPSARHRSLLRLLFDAPQPTATQLALAYQGSRNTTRLVPIVARLLERLAVYYHRIDLDRARWNACAMLDEKIG